MLHPGYFVLASSTKLDTVFGLSLCLMIIWGYKMWDSSPIGWIQRLKPLLQAWRKLSAQSKKLLPFSSLYFWRQAYRYMGVSPTDFSLLMIFGAEKRQ